MRLTPSNIKIAIVGSITLFALFLGGISIYEFSLIKRLEVKLNESYTAQSGLLAIINNLHTELKSSDAEKITLIKAVTECKGIVEEIEQMRKYNRDALMVKENSQEKDTGGD